MLAALPPAKCKDSFNAYWLVTLERYASQARFTYQAIILLADNDECLKIDDL